MAHLPSARHLHRGGQASFTHDRGLHCEFHVDETPRDLWMIGGLHPPPAGSAAEKQWVAAGKPVPYH
ncbi:tautomerase family protein [Nocardia farcinica]|uniref:tautomerase family protein n=1 Tax=Nocardia farcinica TaxID=37329 RepID=UPI003CC80417